MTSDEPNEPRPSPAPETKSSGETTPEPSPKKPFRPVHITDPVEAERLLSELLPPEWKIPGGGWAIPVHDPATCKFCQKEDHDGRAEEDS